jgi:molecular chaperone HtpG
MTERTGTIKVETHDILPIIKKWLYSEHDIFIRELVANSTDAITKRSTLARTLNQEIPMGKILVSINNEKKTISITDNGLGMTEEEVEKYIAQLAFSGAREFMEKMEEEGQKNENGDIIGKFGLGFYSAFMVSNKVEVESLSMNEGANPTKWTSKGETEYTFSKSDKKEVGTTITLHINEESEEFLNAWKMSETLRKFCDFLPYEIGVLDVNKVTYPTKEDGTEDQSKEPLPNEPQVINETTPLWKRDPKELKDEDYINFYRSKFPMDGEPLFWIHLKIDHPFTLDGILFFPKVNQNKPFNESNIRLYAKQMFVTDNVKNIVPEFLSLLRGYIDSSDIPLNVSRSSLQGDPTVKRISGYIVKKVAESLKKLWLNDRTKYENIWNDSGLFIKYGCISDDKFSDLMRDKIIFKNSENNYSTLGEYLESVPQEYKEKMKDKVIYFEKDKSDIALRQQLLSAGVQTIQIDDYIDPHFMQHIEMKKLGDKQLTFTSVDAEIANILGTENATENDAKIKDLFQSVLSPKKEEKPEEKETNPMGDMEGIDIEVQSIKNSTTPAFFRVDEQMKRMAKMTMSMGNNPFPVKKTLVINPSNPLIVNALKFSEAGNKNELVEKICHHVEDLAYISSEGLKVEDRDNFVKRSQDLISDLTTLAL